MNRRTVIASAAASAAGLGAGAAQGAPADAAAWARGESTFRFPGTASDEDAGIRASGPGDVVAGFIGFYRKRPDGKDAESTRWHQFDHMPEQFRLPGLRHGQRWIATPACRAARAAQAPPFDEAVVSQHYLFADPVAQSVKAFNDLGAALTLADRRQFSPPPVENVYYRTGERLGGVGGVVSVHALPWRPAPGVYLVVETAAASDAERAADAAARQAVVKLDGVAGCWRFEPAPELGGDARPDQAVSVYYLYQDPVAMAGPIGEALKTQWAASGQRAKLAGPFHVVRPLEWDRYLP
jgi:hypothetical protein